MSSTYQPWFKRVLIAGWVIVLTLIGLANSVSAKTIDWPNQPIKILVGFPAGGASDVMARIIAEELRKELGQPVVVENKPGAAGTLAASMTARSKSDGYTLLLASPTAITLAPSTMSDKINYNPATDLLPISMVAKYPLFLIANPKLGVKNVSELLDKAKKEPGKINFASFGVFTSGGLAVEQLKLKAKIDVLHVPFNGSSAAMQGLLGGEVDLMFDTAVTALPNIEAGKLVPLAIASTKQSSLAPSIPTVSETLPDFQADSWVGLMAPAGTPADVTSRIQSAVAKIVATDAIKQRFSKLGAETESAETSDFVQHIKDETARYEKLVHDADIKLQ